MNSVSALNETNFKEWNESMKIVLGCMDLDLALMTKLKGNRDIIHSEKQKLLLS